MRRPVFSALAVVITLAACKGPELTGLPNQPGGNPIVPSVAMFPFPTDFYLEEDASTHTGRRVVIPGEALPDGLPASLFELDDGFSRIPAILTWLAGGVDPATLPDPADGGASLDVDASVLLVRAGTWELVPVLAEVDSQAEELEDQSLIIRPRVALEPGEGYVVLLGQGLRDAGGQVHEPTQAFRALRDDLSTDSDAVEAQREDFELVSEAIDALGLDPEAIVQGWSFHTRSREQVTGPALAMHDAMAEAELGSFEFLSDEVHGDNRLIEGLLPLPDFLTADNLLVLDAEGLPVQQGEREVEVLITIPATVTETRPVILFGHGFFASRYEPTWSSLNPSLQEWQMSTVTADFMGFCEEDQLETFGILGGDLAAAPSITAQQLQAQAQFTALHRLVVEQLADHIIGDPDGASFHPLSDTDVHYMGISNGGSQGFPIVAASPLITRGALVVPGGAWSHMLQRAVQWNTMGFLLTQRFEDPVELQLVMSLVQSMLDPVDSLNYADRLVEPRFDGRPPVEVTLHEAVGDCQVANLVTHWVARSASIPLITPSPQDIWGLDTITAPAPNGTDSSAALVLYDEGYPALPSGNVPPGEDNGAHETIRDLEVYVEQVGRFLEDGTIVQICDGACDPD